MSAKVGFLEAQSERGRRLSVREPRSASVPWHDAYEQALALREPVFVPTRIHCDDRGWSLMNMCVGVLSPAGQVNYSVQYPGAVKAWHRHRLQTDFWCCVSGQLKAGIVREEDGVAWALCFGERRPGALIIPPGLWHGATALGAAPAGLLYYVTRAYDPADPDEERRPYDSIPGFPWATRHG